MSIRLHWPTKDGFVTQGFGERPEYYIQFGLPGHEGIDYNAPDGTEIYACADGVVSEVRLDGNSDPFKKPYGNQVRIQHDGGFMTIYAHLQQALVSPGQSVQAGQLIGLSDSTGNVQGAHLHLTVKNQGASQRGETKYPNDIIDSTQYMAPYEAPSGATEQVPTPAQATLQVQVNSPDVGYLNIRSGPSANSPLVTKATDQSTLDVLEPADTARGKVGQQNQWLFIRTSDGQVGYAAAWYVRLPGVSPAPAPAPAPQAISVVVVSPDTPLKVRSGAGIQYDILAQAPDGTVLKALESADAVKSKVGQQGQWLQVRTADDVTGYSAAWYLKLA
jgi:uncharacterized protein YraI